MIRKCSLKQYFNFRLGPSTYHCLHCLQDIEYITLTEIQLMVLKILKHYSLMDDLKLVVVKKYLHAQQYGQEHFVNSAGTTSQSSEHKVVFTSIFRNAGPLLYEMDGGLSNNSDKCALIFQMYEYLLKICLNFGSLG